MPFGYALGLMTLYGGIGGVLSEVFLGWWLYGFVVAELALARINPEFEIDEN